jgi:hypothetical protein
MRQDEKVLIKLHEAKITNKISLPRRGIIHDIMQRKSEQIKSKTRNDASTSIRPPSPTSQNG